MKRETCSSSAAEGGQAARRRGGGRRLPAKKQPPIGKLHKLGLSVRGFVEAAVGPDGNGDSGGGRSDGDGNGSGSSGSFQQPVWIGRRNRQEMKREKRKLKRGRRKQLLNGEAIVNGEAKSPLHLKTRCIRKRSPPPPVEEERKEEEQKKKKKKPLAKQPRTAPSATAATRKRALLAANEVEEREIRRLERQLGLHKRRKKQRGGAGQEVEAAATSLPQSFARDGLDYVLGALKSEAAFSGLYENGDVGEGEGSGTEEEEEGLNPGEEGEDEVGSSWDSSPEEGSESEEGKSSQEAAGLPGGFSEMKSEGLNIAMAEKQNCQAWRPEVKWYNGC